MTVTSSIKSPEALRLTITAEFTAAVERVWQIWADPRQLERWGARRPTRQLLRPTTSSPAGGPATT